jgi:energy-coupling factor transporter ATP-binding protein EcfA2
VSHTVRLENRVSAIARAWAWPGASVLTKESIMKLVGIELRNFRSIGENPVRLERLAKCNVLVGQNNSGKSNILRAIERIGHAFHAEPQSLLLSPIDLHGRRSDVSFEFRLSFTCERPLEAELGDLADHDPMYFDFRLAPGEVKLGIADFSLVHHLEDAPRAEVLFTHLVGMELRDGLDLQERVQAFRSSAGLVWERFKEHVPPVYLIPQFRRMAEATEFGFDGRGVIETLARWQHPPIGSDENRERFRKIEGYARRLLHMPKATLEVQSGDPQLILENDGLRLPLASYGTGVHELLILLVGVLSVERSVCCIEEPEIHLHPRLQRELVSFLLSETDNTYFLSTHSAALVNCFERGRDVQVYHIRVENGATVGGPILSEAGALDALRDLGVKASDILQANCVIWVEGPSDRIYLLRWLQLIADDLQEDRDFVVMFYGGRLLSHLSMQRDKVPEELVPLLRINQHAVVMIDSDRSGPDEELNPTKQRVQQECEGSGCLCWVTDGREIENYLPGSVLEEVCRPHDSATTPLAVGPYDVVWDALAPADQDAHSKAADYRADKVGFARTVVARFGAEHMSGELRARMESVANRIRQWNA